MKVCVVIPTYNEQENIGTLIDEILKVSSQNSLNSDILIVDDGSPDGTADIVRKMAEQWPNIYLVERGRKLGLGSAYKDGFLLARQKLKAEILVEMDADGSHNPAYLPFLMDKISGGYDIAVGSRYMHGSLVKGWGLKRRIISWGANALARKICGVKIRDATSGYRAIKTSALNKVNLKQVSSSGYGFQVELLFWAERASLKIAEVPITFINRIKAKSKLGLMEILKFSALCLRLLSKRWLLIYTSKQRTPK